MAYNKKEYRRKRIKNRIRKIVSGTPVRPRMSVFRSNRDIYVQVIDDEAGVTLVSASSKLPDIASQKMTKCEKLREIQTRGQGNRHPRPRSRHHRSGLRP